MPTIQDQSLRLFSLSRVELKTVLIAIAIIVLGEPSYSFNESWAVA